MKKYITTDGKTCREILMPNEYEDLPVREKAFYTHQWQRWDSGWVDCDEPRVKLTLGHRFVYKLIAPIEKPLEGEDDCGGYRSPATYLDGWNEAISACVGVLRFQLDEINANKETFSEYPLAKAIYTAISTQINDDITRINSLRK